MSVCGTGTLDLTSGFSWQREISRFGSFASPSQLNLGCADLPTHQPHCLDAVKPTPRSTYPSASPRRSNDPWWYRNLYLLSIAYAFRPRLRPRLTLRGRTFLRNPERTNLPQETLDFRRTGFSPALRYSCQHSLSYAVHRTLRYDFCPHTMLLYRCICIPKLRW